MAIVQRIEANDHNQLGQLIKQSDEMWDRVTPPAEGCDSIRYLEIGAVELQGDSYSLTRIPIADAPSRARMFLRAGDIVVSTTRPHRGAVARIRDEDDGAIASTGFAVLRHPNTKKISRDFLLAALLSNCVLTQMFQRSSGGAYPAITPEELDRVRIPTPRPDIQNHLVATLDAARRARRQKLEQADSLLNGLNAFVLDELGLTVTPSEGRTSYAVRLSTVLEGKKLYPDFFHPERLNAIQAVRRKYKGDRCATLQSVADFRRDQRQAQPNDSYLGLANVRPNTGERVESVEEDGEGTVFEYAQNDVLFARLRPYLNKVYRAESAGVCSTEFHVMRVRLGADSTPYVIPDYLAAVLRSGVVLAQTRHMMTGNTHPRLTNDDVVNLVVPIPAQATQQKIADEVARRRNAARHLREEATQLWGDAKRRFEEALLGPAK